jgi:hypothetical protein
MPRKISGIGKIAGIKTSKGPYSNGVYFLVKEDRRLTSKYRMC